MKALRELCTVLWLIWNLGGPLGVWIYALEGTLDDKIADLLAERAR